MDLDIKSTFFSQVSNDFNFPSDIIQEDPKLIDSKFESWNLVLRYNFSLTLLI